MRITTKNLTTELDNLPNSTYLLDKNHLIFDIETTGFSRAFDIIYMVGCICKTDTEYKYVNIFAEDPSQEAELIHYFFDLLENMECVIHFNGNRFDIPFLLARANKYNITDQISHLESIDIYDLLRPFRKSLNFPNLKLDTIQAHLGYKRKDMYTGGNLIPIYHNYVEKPYEPYYQLLALHNTEDVEGMINLLPIIDMIQVIDYMINNKNIDFANATQDKNEISVIYELPSKASMNFSLRSPCHTQIVFTEGTNKIQLKLPISEDEKLFFFDNYKDYMYLIETDEIMHKSVANFVPREQKRKAKKSECYVSQDGLFIKAFFSITESEAHLRLFKDELRSKTQFVMAGPELDGDFYKNQVQGFLKTAKGIK